jgi:hypothetical protein
MAIPEIARLIERRENLRTAAHCLNTELRIAKRAIEEAHWLAFATLIFSSLPGKSA